MGGRARRRVLAMVALADPDVVHHLIKVISTHDLAIGSWAHGLVDYLAPEFTAASPPPGHRRLGPLTKFKAFLRADSGKGVGHAAQLSAPALGGGMADGVA